MRSEDLAHLRQCVLNYMQASPFPSMDAGIEVLRAFDRFGGEHQAIIKLIDRVIELEGQLELKRVAAQEESPAFKSAREGLRRMAELTGANEPK